MSFTFTKSSSFSFGSVAGSEVASVESEMAVQASITVAAGKPGTLTTRTDNDTGTLTMETGHGIITGDTIDLYWDGGQRRNVTVGTVATNSVPIDLGEGDNLPVATTEIIACVVTEQPFIAEGDDLKAIVANFTGGDGTSKCQVTFMDGSTVVGSAVLTPPYGYSWYTGSGITNPLAGDSVTGIQLSNGSETQSVVIGVAVGYD